MKTCASKIASKKGPRPDANKYQFPCQKAPGQAATIKNCSNKKILFGHMMKQVFVIFRKCGLNSKSVQKMWIGFKIGAEF